MFAVKGPPGADRAGSDKDDMMPRPLQRRDLLRQLAEQDGIGRAIDAGQRQRADLDHQPEFAFAHTVVLAGFLPGREMKICALYSSASGERRHKKLIKTSQQLFFLGSSVLLE